MKVYVYFTKKNSNTICYLNVDNWWKCMNLWIHIFWNKLNTPGVNLFHSCIPPQAMLLISSILGTGTIFLMIVGALTLVLKNAIPVWGSLLLNIIPLLFYIIICYKAKTGTQVNTNYAPYPGCCLNIKTVFLFIEILVIRWDGRETNTNTK